MTTPTPRTDGFAERGARIKELERELDAARCELETAHAISRHETQKLVGMVHEQAAREKLNAEFERELIETKEKLAIAMRFAETRLENINILTQK
jgi:translation elongation factor EF-4